MAFKDARRERGLYRAEVLRTERVTPHMVRVTVGGDDLTRLPHHGYDQWFRLFLPQASGATDFSAVPDQFGLTGYVKFLLSSPAATRPIVRSYTAREFRPESGEVDIDFVSHGDLGEAGPWARRAQPGETVMLLDQGRGFDPQPDASAYLFAGDESALPAIVGILRDLPRDARGIALLEVIDAADAQPCDAPRASICAGSCARRVPGPVLPRSAPWKNWRSRRQPRWRPTSRGNRRSPRKRAGIWWGPACPKSGSSSPGTGDRAKPRSEQHAHDKRRRISETTRSNVFLSTETETRRTRSGSTRSTRLTRTSLGRPCGSQAPEPMSIQKRPARASWAASRS